MKRFTLIVALLIAVAQSSNGERAIGLLVGNQLVHFDTASPTALGTPVAITGLQGGLNERVEGIDFRPRTGALYALGVVTGATDTVRLYVLNADTGAAAPIGSGVSVTSGTSYGFDFNPTVDRIRVVNSGDENFRLNPNNGARADSPVNDTDLTPPLQGVDAAAYDRNADNLLGAGGTTLYAISRTLNQLVTIGGVNQSPSPNGGAINAIGSLNLTINPAGGVGFDISGASGVAYAALTTTQSGLYTINLSNGVATLVGLTGNGSNNFVGLTIVPPARVIFGAEGTTVARVYDPVNDVFGDAGLAFPARSARGIRVAGGDVNRDGVPETIFATGPGVAPAVKIFDGKTGGFLLQFLPYELDFRGGVFVAAGDVNGDGFDDVIAATGRVPNSGPPTEVRVFSGQNYSLLGFFQPVSDFRGGVTVAAADVDLDGRAEVVVGSGLGRTPTVSVFRLVGSAFTEIASFEVGGFSTRGIFVAASTGTNVTIAVGAASASQDVSIFTSPVGSVPAFTFSRNIFATPKRTGARVALLDLNHDGTPELFATPAKSSAVTRVIDLATDTEVTSLDPFRASGGYIGTAR